jgi:CrcB protein
MTTDDNFDSDVDLDSPSQRRELASHPAMVLGAISVGGVAGALARYGIALAVPHSSTGFPVSTLIINVTGSLLIGVLMVALGHRRHPHPLLRPFLGVGILGGFTTFSTYVVDAQQLIVHHEAGLAILYLAATLVLGLAAVAVGAVLARLVLVRGTR